MAERSDAATTDTGRVEAFSDAVVAIALTLLVLDLIVEHGLGRFGAELLAQWPAYLAYVAAFLTISSIWVSHHDGFSRLERVDPPVRILNLGLLLGIALVPWPAALIAAALSEDGPAAEVLADRRAAVVVYVVVSILVSVAWSALSGAIARRPELLADRAEAVWFRRNARYSILAGVVSVVGGAVGLLVPIAALVIFLLVPVGFVVVSLLAARRGG